MTWKLIASEPLVSSRWLRVFRNTYQLPNGQQIDDYYVVERADFVLVVASDNESVILVRQYRPATGRQYLSLPAGYIDQSESPVEAASRELEEETGIRAEKYVLIGELHPLPGYIKSSAYVVLCTGLSGELAVQDTTEIERAIRIPWALALAMIRTGEINEMQAVSALLLARECMKTKP
jgi:ADP-ribose diphosphatase